VTIAVPGYVLLAVTTPLALFTDAESEDAMLHVPLPVSASARVLPSHNRPLPLIACGTGYTVTVSDVEQPEPTV
jgi:hypothetical protein